MCDHDTPAEPIYSTLAQSDPSFAEIVEIFVCSLPAKVNEMQDACAECDLETLRKLAQQLKGSGGGHGYPEMTEQAAAVEHSCVAGTLAEAKEQLNELIQVIARVRVRP